MVKTKLMFYRKVISGIIGGAVLAQACIGGTAFAAEAELKRFTPVFTERQSENTAYSDMLEYTYPAAEEAVELFSSDDEWKKAKYDPRETIGDNWPVQDQGQEGNCWAFSAMASREAYVNMIENDNYSSDQAFKMFSPYHLAASTYKNTQNMWSFNVEASNGGGNREFAAAYFARNSGPVNLSDFGRNLYDEYIKTKDFSKVSSVTGDDQVTSAIFLTDDNGSYDMEKISGGLYRPKPNSYSTSNHAVIKQAVVKYGAVMSSYHAPVEGTDENELYYNEDEAAYCYCPSSDTPSGTNHGVTIVGWDDNYPAENFKTLPDWTEGGNADGAWIIRNSWGSDFGDGGYMYISYYDYFMGCKAAVFPGSMEKSDYVNQHDGLWPYSSFEKFTSGYYTVVRHATETPEQVQKINAIGVIIQDSGTSVSLLIEDDAEEAEPKVPAQVAVKPQLRAHASDAVTVTDNKASFKYPGYYVMELEEPVFVSNQYDIYLKYENKNGYSVVPIMMKSDYFCHANTVAGGKSWYGIEELLTDDSNESYHFPVKTYSDAVTEPVFAEAESSYDADSGKYQLTVDIGYIETEELEGKIAIVAVYDKNGVLASFKVEELHFEENKQYDSLSLEYDEAGSNYRIMIWDGLEPIWAMAEKQKL